MRTTRPPAPGGTSQSNLIKQELALEQLRQGEERWQLSLRWAGDGLWDWDIVKGTVFRSQRCLELLGYGPLHLPESKAVWAQLIPPSDLKGFREAIDVHLFTVASIACDTLCKGDLIARTGGDEFVFLLPDTNANETLFLVERIRTRFDAIQFELTGSPHIHTSC